MAYDKAARPEGGFKRRNPGRRRKKVCVFCGKENNEIDYKLCKTSESSYSSNQESSSRCINAIRAGLISS